MLQNRRGFLKGAAGFGGAFCLLGDAFAAIDAKWKNQIGLELFTVRDLIAKDYEGTLAKVAEIGYKEIEPATNGYANLDPKQFRALLDKLGLSMPSTHNPATEGPDLEKELEGFQAMGIKYTEIRAAGRGGGGRGQTEESVKRQADQLNKHGELVKKFGMKMLVHNHTMEFQPFEGGKKRPYDILLSETDPKLVTMQIDIGWASVAGQNVLEMFHEHPGRFELWHVKDAAGIKDMKPEMNQGERMRAAKLVPVGEGEVDYKTLFSHADHAGLKHFCIEQDSAAESGSDSIAAARTSYRNLRRMLS